MSKALFLPDPESEPEPREVRSNTFRNVAIALSIIGGVLVLSCCGFGGVLYFAARDQFQKLQEAFVDKPVVLPAPEIETLEQRRADLHAGFGAAQPEVDPVTLAAVNAFFDKLVESTQDENEPAFRSLIDGSRFMGEVKKRGVLKELTQSGEISLIADYQNRWISIPAYWNRFRIANVKLSRNGRDAVAYVYFWDSSQAVSEVRWWITLSGGQWKAYDWEQLEFGTRMSLEAAVYTRDSALPRTTEHIQALTEITNAYKRFGDGDQKAAAELLTQAERRTAIPELADNLAVRLAYGWRIIGKPRNCLLAARKARNPGVAAGTLYVQAAVYQQYGLHRRALDFAKQYEEAIGGGPASDEQLADILDSLGERQAAVIHRQKVLRFDPDNVGELFSLAAAADGSQSQLVVDLVQKASAPVERALGLVAHVAANGDQVVAQALADFVIQTDPQSARAAAAEAQLAVALGDDDRGAAAYKTAIERADDDESRESYVSGFLDAMSSAGKLLEAYEQAPDQKAAFRHLANGGDDDEAGLAPDNLKALCQAHRDRFPDDPWLHYQTGLLLEHEQDAEGAERELRAALEDADEDDDQLIRGALLSLLDRTGKCLEAYEGRLLPSREAFQQLVQTHDGSQSVCDLGELHKRHFAAHPDDPWLDACAAIVQRDAGNKQEALRLAMHGYETTKDDSIKQQYRWRVIGLANEIGDIRAVYKVSYNPDEALRTLWQRPEPSGASQQRQALLDQHKQSRPITALWRMFQAERLWDDQDYAGLVRTVEPVADAMLGELGDWDVGRFGDLYVRSLLKVGRADDARSFAAAVCDQCGKTLPLLNVSAHDRNVAEIEKLLAEFGNDTWKISVAYNDSEIGPVLRSAEFLPVRRKFPPEPGVSFSRSGVVLLLDAPSTITTDDLKSAASVLLGNDVAVEPFAAPPGMPSPGVVESWLVRAGHSCLSIAAGGDRRFAEAGPDVDKQHSEALSRALARHRGWVSLRWLGPDRSEAADRTASSPIYRLAARLRNDHCLALSLSPDNVVIVNSPELGAILESEDPHTELTSRGEVFWLPRQRVPDSEGSQKRDAEFSRSLAKLDVAFQARSPEDSLEIGILVRDEDLAEVLKLDLVHASKAPYRGRTFRGTFKTNSRLCPELVAGEPLSVSEYQVVEWTIIRGETVERAMRW